MICRNTERAPTRTLTCALCNGVGPHCFAVRHSRCCRRFLQQVRPAGDNRSSRRRPNDGHYRAGADGFGGAAPILQEKGVGRRCRRDVRIREDVHGRPRRQVRSEELQGAHDDLVVRESSGNRPCRFGLLERAHVLPRHWSESSRPCGGNNMVAKGRRIGQH